MNDYLNDSLHINALLCMHDLNMLYLKYLNSATMLTHKHYK